MEEATTTQLIVISTGTYIENQKSQNGRNKTCDPRTHTKGRQVPVPGKLGSGRANQLRKKKEEGKTGIKYRHAHQAEIANHQNPYHTNTQ